ncbi:hypothetical protein K466DRAFT_8395 [Polyporus arcularius HHB13444]|uniref:Uncharacterized protein n=2 Tax=Polyporaceae TaxID=5317 RepID=A0A5C3PUN8_9APHY|nr:hypothetical protein OH76DRAFT_1402614 [Polyporus brumalis]TFK89843.1 hypothetical protein K466DRAFT_8395 [Polyporus arcularius HHB13444]
MRPARSYSAWHPGQAAHILLFRPRRASNSMVVWGAPGHRAHRTRRGHLYVPRCSRVVLLCGDTDIIGIVP